MVSPRGLALSNGGVVEQWVDWNGRNSHYIRVAGVCAREVVRTGIFFGVRSVNGEMECRAGGRRDMLRGHLLRGRRERLELEHGWERRAAPALCSGKVNRVQRHGFRPGEAGDILRKKSRRRSGDGDHRGDQLKATNLATTTPSVIGIK